MEKVLEVLLLGRVHFHELGLRGRVALGQLPLNLTMLLACIVVLVVDPGRLADQGFLVGQAVAAFLLVLCALVPWARLPQGSFLAVPFLDFVAVGLVRASASDVLSGLGLMAVFPVMWIAASGIRPRLTVPLTGAAALLMVWAPPFFSGDVSARVLAAQLLTPFILLAIGVGTAVATVSSVAQQARVEELLERAETRERLLDTVLETVDVGVLVLDGEGQGMFANSKQVDVYAAAVPDEGARPGSGPMVYRDASEEPLPPEEWALERALAGERIEHELYRLGAGPSARTVSVTAREFADASGRRGGMVLASSDVTEVVAAVRARDRFLSTMSHEFRTPVANILGYAEMVLEDPGLSPTSRGDMGVIVRNARHVNTMVDNILAAASSGTDREGIRLPLDLAELVRQAGESSAAEAGRRQIGLSISTDGDLPVVGDPTSLVRVLDNLVSNALKYSGPGTEVVLTAKRRGTWAECTVQDQGRGITADELEHIFTRFGRGSSVLGTGIPGTGLGLALAKTVVERHGGTIECTSEVGAGSVFTLRIPLEGTEL